MRITGGRARGIPLHCPKGKQVRPATDKMREAVFSSLGNIEGFSCLDLFAGVGSYGLEALSRGAKNVTFIEKDRNAHLSLQQNISAVCKSANESLETCSLVKADVFSQLKKLPKITWDIVFIDPPYPIIASKGANVLDLLNDHVSDETLLIFEMPQGTKVIHPRFSLIKTLGSSQKDSPQVSLYQLA